MRNTRKLADLPAELWHADLDISEEQLACCAAYLDADEHARAARFVTSQLSHRFIAARGTLRYLLGEALRVSPRSLRFRYGPHGKPSLVDEFGAVRLEFNLSHSDGCALIAITHGREVGVDIERSRPGIEIESLARRFFAAPEYEWIAAARAAERVQRFYACWTAKEAFTKAHGAGLSFPLQKFEVLPDPESGDLRLLVYGDPAESARWSIERVLLGAGWAGALCVATT